MREIAPDLKRVFISVGRPSSSTPRWPPWSKLRVPNKQIHMDPFEF